MVDPSDITNYNLSKHQLQEVLLFWVLAAGKNGTVAARNLDKLMRISGGYVLGPFAALRFMVDRDNYVNSEHPMYFANILKRLGIGCYRHKARTISELVRSNLDLSTCKAEDLERIYGIGMKTSRCFIIHSRQNARYAGLDTHVLKFLNIIGVNKVPKSTPSSKKEYLRLEQAFLEQADKCHRTPADLDLLVWNELKVVNKVTA